MTSWWKSRRARANDLDVEMCTHLDMATQDRIDRGESPDDVGRRADRVVVRLRGLTGDALVFSHGHLLRVLAARWLGRPAAFARHLLLDTAAVCALGFGHGDPDEPAVALWNDTGHV